MSSNNSTTPDFRPVELNTLALGIIKDAALDAEDSIAELALSSLLFGEELSLTLPDSWLLQGCRSFDDALRLVYLLSYVRTDSFVRNGTH